MVENAIRDAEATRERLLAAATDEFARHGVAGARVDRIASAAAANKQLIYAYFDNKDGLFDAALARICGALAEEVPFDAEDMPGYVGRLFDYALEHPEVYRLVSWAALERPGRDRGLRARLLRRQAQSHRERTEGRPCRRELGAGRPPGATDGDRGCQVQRLRAIRRFDSKDPMSPRRLAQFRRAAIESAYRMLSPTGT